MRTFSPSLWPSSIRAKRSTFISEYECNNLFKRALRPLGFPASVPLRSSLIPRILSICFCLRSFSSGVSSSLIVIPVSLIASSMRLRMAAASFFLASSLAALMRCASVSRSSVVHSENGIFTILSNISAPTASCTKRSISSLALSLNAVSVTVCSFPCASL